MIEYGNYKYGVLEENYDHEYLIDYSKNKTNSSMLNMHRHDSYEIYFLLSGDVRYVIEHDIYDVISGNLVIVPKNKVHMALAQSEKIRERFLISFTDDFISPIHKHISPEIFKDFFNLGCVQLSKNQQEKVLQIFTAMEKEQLRQDDYSKLKISALLCDLIVLILRHGSMVERSYPDTTESHIVEAMQYIQKNFNQDISLQSVARIACMETTYFSKCFKKVAGINFHEFLTRTRLKNAEDLLSSSKLSINQVAEDCGFFSSKNFWAVFKKHTGYSPREYKVQAHKNKQEKISS